MTGVISINNLFEKTSISKRAIAALLDRILGVTEMNRLYQRNNMQGLSKEDFADKLIDVLALDITGLDELKSNIPKTGPVVIASNHPFGGIEGVILARAIGQVRPDLKVLANKSLGIFHELTDYFIFTNPLASNDPKNAPSLRKCIQHIKSDQALLIFPAGKVAYLDPESNDIIEHPWNKIIGRLMNINDCQFVPVFVNGRNSPRFYRIERIIYKMRMLMLSRELLNKNGASILINSGFPLENKHIKAQGINEISSMARALSYAQEGSWRYSWPPDTVTQYKPLAKPVPTQELGDEIRSLPAEQFLISANGFDVYYAYQHQAPKTVHEIARLRELVFREHNEGSGESIDTDKFDATYIHLFAVKTDSMKIIGAYRMGLTDKLIEEQGVDGLYLNKMFKFGEQFINQKQAAMELGRSFLIPEFQGSYQGLLMLWKGIGTFVCRFPEYANVYGTVSISKLYDPRSVNLIQHIMINQNAASQAEARDSFDFPMHSEIARIFEQKSDAHQDNAQGMAFLTSALKTLENDGKDIPVLAKQYWKLGAQFHCLGIDTSFNHTPGLLLSVDLRQSPKKLLKLYLGDGYQAFLDASKNTP